MYQLVFYVPVTHVEAVKTALFAVGAGKIGDFDCCAWQVEGEGQFRPLDGSKPFLGAIDELEKVREYRVEMVLEEKYLEAVITALKEAHPYEEPAYVVIPVIC